MGSLSDYSENKLLDHVLENGAYTPPATPYLALSTADPTDAGSGLAEPSGNGYTRKAITFGAAASRVISNSGAVTFDQATGSWGTITHYAIMDASSGGNMLAYGALAASKSVVSGNTPSVAVGEVDLTFSANEVSNYLANIWLDFMFRNQSFSQPTIYVALTTATISDSDTGSTITEPGAGSYAREACSGWDAASGGASDNTAAITFTTATASWGTIVATALLDASSAGNLLLYDNGITDQAVGSGDTAYFNAGEWDVSLD